MAVVFHSNGGAHTAFNHYPSSSAEAFEKKRCDFPGETWCVALFDTTFDWIMLSRFLAELSLNSLESDVVEVGNLEEYPQAHDGHHKPQDTNREGRDKADLH
jgi:hypothetical protein